MSAAVTCDQVRRCLSAGPGVAYDPATGVIGADVSDTPGNNLVIDENGLFVPAGAATVTTGCGVLGDGSASSPVRANTAALPGCPEAALQPVYCRSDGTLATVPEKQTATLQIDAQPPGSGCLLVNDLAPDDGAFHTIATGTGSITNPSPCLPMTVRLSAGVRHAQYVARGPGDNEIEIGARVTLSGAINQVLTQLVAHQHWRAENIADGDRWTYDSVGAYDDVSFTLAPGASVNVLLEGTLFNAQSSPTSCISTPKFRLSAEGVND
ncbi:hypothetical protein QBA54_32750 [Streptomyces sp. B21-108]|uniref:hypothetical protein n=1 Tax=Streptomyces sp. B21-108 TaxID=3039419 RepID=UPI002FEFBC00